MLETHDPHGSVMQSISDHHLWLKRDDVLAAQIDELFQGTARIRKGRVPDDDQRPWSSIDEGRLLVLTGAPGAGKSFAMRHHLRRMQERYPSLRCLSAVAPGTCTLRQLGVSILMEMGRPVRSSARENEVWEHVRTVIEVAKIDMLYLDEAQHVAQSRNWLESQKVRDTLKGLVQGRRPVSIILSGMEEIADLVKADRQLLRRASFATFGRLEHAAVPRLAEYLTQMAEVKAGMRLSGRMSADQLVERLLHASEHQLGHFCDLLRAAINCALNLSSPTLEPVHFAEVFRKQYGSRNDENPFVLGDDWQEKLAAARLEPASD